MGGLQIYNWPVMRRIVYFVGAGLPKALERPGNRIPLMADFLATMADHLDNHVVQVGLADFQRQQALPWPAGQPIRSFIDKVTGRSTLDPAEVAEVARQLKRLPEENIEILLSGSPELKTRVSFIVNAIFCDVGFQVDWACLDKFLKKVLQTREAKHTFVSFNYDLLLDRRVQEVAPVVGLSWNLEDGYGFQARLSLGPQDSFATDSVNQESAGLEEVGEERDTVTVEDEAQITILKPHGSLNWVVPFLGNYEFEDNSPNVICAPDGLVAYLPEFDFSFLNGIFMIPPMQTKSSSLTFVRRILDLERAAIRDADEIYVLGWSMPRTDTDQVCLISDTVRQRWKPLRRLTVVNYGAQVEYLGRIATAFGFAASEMQVFNAGFCDSIEIL